jgi:hypothetical protein
MACLRNGSDQAHSAAPRTRALAPPWLGIILLAILAATGWGCRPGSMAGGPGTAAGPPWFADITEESGLDFVHDAGPTDDYFFPQIVGSGAAFFRGVGGRLYLYLVQNAGPKSGATNRLYRRGDDGRFTDVSAGCGLDVAGYGMGVAVGDVNNDGHPDIVLTEYSGLRLFLNNGDDTFRDVTKEAGLDNPLWGTSAAFLDFDRDGRLDLVVANYVHYNPAYPCAGPGSEKDYCHPRNFSPAGLRLYRNLGGAASKTCGVRFEDVTTQAGFDKKPGPGLGVVCADFDGDGWPDILVANDAQANQLWINHHDGTFTEEAVQRGLAYNGLGMPQGNMGVAVGDVDGDGLFDVFITHLNSETHTLWKQGPPGVFRDNSPAAGIVNMGWRATGWGTVLADFDNDGALDLALVNGRVIHGKPASEDLVGPFWGRYAERNQLLSNDGSGRFTDRSDAEPALCGTAAVARGLAVADVDGDGALDLLVTYIAGRARLYRNIASQRGHWLRVRAVDPALHRDAYGAEVRVQAGSRTLVRLLSPGQSYLCSHDPQVHFGLGAAERVDRIEVHWPDGSREAFPAQAADQVVELRKGEGTRIEAPVSGATGKER